eukprot:s598_g25.t1
MAWRAQLGRAALPLALLLCQLREAQLLFSASPNVPKHPGPRGTRGTSSTRPSRATSGDPASIGIVEPLVNQLPRQERETFMGLLRFLSLPVDDVWFSAILLILVRFRLVKKLVMASQHWRRWLTTYCRRLRSQEDRSLLIEALDTNQVLQKTIRLSGGGFLRQGARLVSPAYVGDTLELGGFENMALNTEFVLCKAEGLQHGKPVFQSRNKEFMLSSAVTDQGKVWIVSPDEKFQQTKNQGSPEGWPLKRYGALLVSPVDAHLLEAPQLNWQELTESGKWILQKNAGLVKCVEVCSKNLDYSASELDLKCESYEDGVDWAEVRRLLFVFLARPSEDHEFLNPLLALGRTPTDCYIGLCCLGYLAMIFMNHEKRTTALVNTLFGSVPLWDQIPLSYWETWWKVSELVFDTIHSRWPIFGLLEIVGTLVRKDPQLSRADSADGCCDYFDQDMDQVFQDVLSEHLASGAVVRASASTRYLAESLSRCSFGKASAYLALAEA